MGSRLREDVLKIVRRHANLVERTDSGFKFVLKSADALKDLVDVEKSGSTLVSLEYQDLETRGVDFSGDSALYIRSYAKSDFEGFAGFVATLLLRTIDYDEDRRASHADAVHIAPTEFESWKALFLKLGFEATPLQIFGSAIPSAPRRMVRLPGGVTAYALECNNAFVTIRYPSS